MTNIKYILGQNLKYYRKQKKLSQEQLSEKVEITPKHLSSIETGVTFVSADLLEKLTQILDVSASDLFCAGEKTAKTDLLEKFTQILGVSPSDLFYIGEKTAKDENLFNLVTHIVEKELAKTVECIKIELKQIKNL